MTNSMEHPINTERAYLARIIEQHALPLSIVIAGIAIGVGLYTSGASDSRAISVAAEIAPQEGVELPVQWGDLGKRLVEVGAIDAEAFASLYEEGGELPREIEQLLKGNTVGRLKITPENSGVLLNLLWALGLANKNPILEDKKEMMNPDYGGDGPPGSGFASTGGWTIAKGDAMEHYNMHALVSLSPDQQKLVDRVARGIYRPCCNNSVHFPDCNHGMAMLGLLELLASQGVSEEEMYKAALVVNSYWFPDTYQTIAKYVAQKGVEWNSLEPRQILGAKYSSASGYAKIAASIETRQSGGGSQCGV